MCITLCIPLALGVIRDFNSKLGMCRILLSEQLLPAGPTNTPLSLSLALLSLFFFFNCFFFSFRIRSRTIPPHSIQLRQPSFNIDTCLSPCDVTYAYYSWETVNSNNTHPLKHLTFISYVYCKQRVSARVR